MHFTPWPRWFRIVSIATVVLPVLRSPMMSSRWPRPIGVMASMALIPVWSGSWTGLRYTIPGACTSRRRWASATRGPFPSMGWPRASTTRPISESPTGTERIRPVAFTAWPSSTSWASPRMTAPIESSSRFRARPRVPPVNSRTSLTAMSGRPATRAMPSPTSRTRPTRAWSTLGTKVSTWRRSASAISSALMVNSGMTPPPWWSGGGSTHASDLLLELLETVTDRAVDHGVADSGDDPAEDRRVHDHLDLDSFAGRVAERIGEPLGLGLVERDGAAHLGQLAFAFGGGELDKPFDDGGQVAGVAGGDDHRDQRGAGGEGLAVEELVDEREPPVDRELRVAERHSKALGALHRAREAEQVVLDVGEWSLASRDLEEALGVRLVPFP